MSRTLLILAVLPALLCACGGAPRFQGGAYAGEVLGEGAISFRLSDDGRWISKLKVTSMERCGDMWTRPTKVEVAGPLELGQNGRLRADGQDKETGYSWRLEGQFTAADTASGTVIQTGQVLGATCTTGERTWTAKRK